MWSVEVRRHIFIVDTSGRYVIIKDFSMRHHSILDVYVSTEFQVLQVDVRRVAHGGKIQDTMKNKPRKERSHCCRCVVSLRES